jgi:hypothetical protein
MFTIAALRTLVNFVAIAVALGACSVSAAAPPPTANDAKPVRQEKPPAKRVRAWKYRIMVDSYRFTPRQGARTIRVPEHDVGELWLDLKGGRFVYRIRYDDETWKKYAQPGEYIDRQNADFLISSAGFDGKHYWVARFDTKWLWLDARASDRGGQHQVAREVHVYESQDALKKDDGEKGYRWYTSAPLHYLLMRINCKTWDHDALSAALSGSKFVTEDPNRAEDLRVKGAQDDPPRNAKYFFYTPWKYKQQTKAAAQLRSEAGHWEFLVELDREPVAIRRCLVTHASRGWFGPWPYPTDSSYYVIRDGEKDGVSDTEFSYDTYVNEKTRVERHSDKR